MTTPPGVEAGKAQFPEALEIPSNLPPPEAPTVAVYEGTITALVPLAVAPTAPPGAQTIHVIVYSQACNDVTNVCLLPAKTSLDVPVTIAPAGTAATLVDPALFETARRQKFLKMPPAATGPSASAPALTATIVPTAAPPTTSRAPGTDVLLYPELEDLRLISGRDYTPFNQTEYSLGFIILFALLGGAILNIMPCVLPVIPLKVLGLVQQAHGDRGKSVLHGLVFSAGIIGLFMLLAAVLKTCGLFYGQQFQSTAFLIGMALFVLALALSMLGVWTINPPRAVYNVDAGHAGVGGSFLNGVLATLLATPCSAPYLGPVLAWALVQPAWITVLALGLVGVGMSLPYLVLTAFPGLLSVVPRAGRWSELLKQAMGIVMIGVAIYLITRISNVTLWPWVFFGALVLGLVCWAWGQLPTPSMSAARVWSIRSVSVVVGALFGAGLYHAAATTPAPAAKDVDMIRLPDKTTTQWLPFKLALLDEGLQQGRPVVVDWTANWCINCRAVEAYVLSNAAVQQGFIANNAVLLRADLTDNNPAAQALNRKLGGESIPVLAIFSPQRPLQPVVKRDAYSREWVLAELRGARGRAGGGAGGTAEGTRGSEANGSACGRA